MFGRSTSSRFKDKVDSTPGPGDYDARAVSTTSKRGPSMGIGTRTLHAASEFAHLGPGAYSLGGEAAAEDGARRGGGALRAGALDYTAALKKLAASFTKVMGPAAAVHGAQRELSREDVCGLAGKLVAESMAVCSDVVRIKGELDGINSRVKDEVQAALKPSKATGSAGNPAAWKMYTPLEKAVEHTSGDLAKKLAKLSSFLAALHEDFPALAVALADGDRIGQLSQMVEVLEANLEAVQKQAAESAAAAESASSENQALLQELAGYKRMHMQQQVRADRMEALMASQKEIVHTLEEQIEASHAQQDALWAQLLAHDSSQSADTCADVDHQDILDQCKESRDAHEQTLQELHAMQLQMTEVLVQNEHDKAAMEEQMLAASDVASSAASAMLSEVDECRALLMQSHRDKRIIRSTVSAMEASRRALKSCLAAGAKELSTLHAEMAACDSHPLSMPSPQMLRPEARDAVSQLDKSLTDDLLATQMKVEELTEALSSTEQQLFDAQIELTKLQEETATRSADAHSQDLQLTETVDGLMHDHHEAEQQLRAELLAQEELVRDLQQQLLLLRNERDEKMERINELNASLEDLTCRFQDYTETSTAEKEQMMASATDAQTRHTAAMESALEQHRLDNAANEAKLAQTVGKYEQDLSDKALQVDALAQQVAQVAAELEATRSAHDAELASLSDRLKQQVALTNQLEATKTQHQDLIAQLESDFDATKQELKQTQAELERTASHLQGELASSQEEVAQLTDTKAQHEGKIALLEGELEATKQELSHTQAELERVTHDLQGELDGKVECISQLEALLAMTRSKLDVSLRERQQALDTLTATTQRLQEEAMQMAADMQAMHLNNVNKMQKALRQQHAHAQSKLAHAADQQARVQESLECTADELARSKQEWERTTCDLQGQLAASQDQVAQLTETKAQHQDLIAKLEGELDATKQQLSQTQAELERVMHDLQGELASSQEEVAQLTDTKAQHEGKIAQLEGDLDASRQELKQTQAELERITHELQGELASSQEEVAQLTDTKAQHEGTIDKLEGAIEATKHELSQTQSALEAAGQLEQQLRESLAASQEEVAQLTETKVQHEGTIDKLEGAIEATKHELSQTQSALEAAGQLEQQLRESLAQTETALQSSRTEASDLGEELEQVSEQLAHASADRNDKAQRIDLLSAHALELSNNLQDERTQRQAESEQAAEEARAAAQRLHFVEIAHKEAELAQNERIAKLDARVGDMTTEVEQSKTLLRDMTVRVDSRSKHLTSLLEHSDAQLSDHKQKLGDALQQLSDAREAHAAEVTKLLHDQTQALQEMQMQHAQHVNDWQSKLSEAQEQHAAQLEELQRSAIEAREAATVEHQQAMAQQKAHNEAVKAQLSDKLQQVEQRAAELARSLEDARAELSKTNQEAQAAREDSERELAAAQSKIDMLGNALKGTEQEKAQALAAISNMYEHTDQQLKAMAGAGAAPAADAGSLARIATLQVCLRSPCLCVPGPCASIAER